MECWSTQLAAVFHGSRAIRIQQVSELQVNRGTNSSGMESCKKHQNYRPQTVREYQVSAATCSFLTKKVIFTAIIVCQSTSQKIKK